MELTKELKDLLTEEEKAKVKEYNEFNSIVLKVVDGNYQVSTDIEFLKLLSMFDYTYAYTDSASVYRNGMEFEEKINEIAVTDPKWLSMYKQLMSFNQPGHIPLKFPSVPDRVFKLKNFLSYGFGKEGDDDRFSELTRVMFTEINDYVDKFNVSYPLFSEAGSNVKEMADKKKFLAMPPKKETLLANLIEEFLEIFARAKDPKELKLKMRWLESETSKNATLVMFRGLTFFVNKS